MLKVYLVCTYVSIDGSDWTLAGDLIKSVRDDDPTDKIFFENLTFEQCCEYLQEHHLNGVQYDTTCFRKKPIIRIEKTSFGKKHYKSFNSISYKKVYMEWKTVPLSWIFKHLSAEQMIQYFKDRGITICPIEK